jgi:hypothetical protein
MLSYTQQVEYLKQEERKIKQKLENIYKIYSDENWVLESTEYYSQKTACDYPKCPRGSINNGINYVYRVINKQTGTLLNLGSDCYFKLRFDSPILSEKQHEQSKQLTKSVKREHRALEKNKKDYQKLVTDLLKKITSISEKFSELGISLDGILDTALEKKTYSDTLKTAKLLDNSLTKYHVERQKLEELQKKRREKQREQYRSQHATYTDYLGSEISNNLSPYENFWAEHKARAKNWRR